MNNKAFILSFSLLALSNSLSAGTAFSSHLNWQGAYVGGFIGGAAGTQVTTSEPLRLDNNTYWFRPFNQPFSFDTGNSFLAGGTAGYNWALGLSPFLIGIEGEYGYLNLRGSSVDINQASYESLPNNNIFNASLNTTRIGSAHGYGLLGGRVGYIKDRSLFYLKSGPVWTKIDGQYTSAKTDSTSNTGIAYLNISGDKNVVGYGVGGGIEYVLPFKGLTHVSAKLEYLYLGLENKQFDYGHCSCDFLWVSTERIRGVHTLKVAMNYKFSQWV